jgi:CheY-like chemotaxis protein/two-component sensor histidine kinase
MDVSRITGGRLELRRSQVELADVVRNAVEATKPAMDQAGHQFHLRLPAGRLRLDVDANRMTQVITNLLHNAAKYTPPKGRIELTAEHLGGEVTIAVSDTGIGIPAAKIDSVFEMFTQIHEGGEHGRTGLGIGLTLVKRLVEMHGGSVAVQSGGPNLGTTFQVRLPAAPNSSADVARAPQECIDPPTADMRRVLVVDDNVDILDSLGRLVATMGHDVRRAQDGLEAIEICRTFQPHIVLMDLGMPRLDGLEAARRMRQEPWGKELALVAISGWGQDSDRQRTAEAGFDRHLVKPITIISLREVLEAPVLSRAGMYPPVKAG